MSNIEEKFCISSNIYKKNKGNRVYIYNNYSKTGCFLKQKEMFVLQQLDGESTYDDLLTREVFALSKEGYNILINKFKKLNLLKNYESKQDSGMLRYKIGLFNPNNWMDKNIKYISRLMSFIFVFSLPLGVIGVSITNYNLMSNELFNMINLKSGVILYVASFVFLAFHELAHAFMAKKGGAEIVEVGLMIYLFIPFVYVTIGGIQQLERKCKILTASAGMLTNIFFCGLFLVFMKILPNGYKNTLLLSFFLCNVGQIIINCNVFLKVDTCYIIESLLGLSMIYDNSRKLFKERKNDQSTFDWKRIAMKVYGIFSIINTIVMPLFVVIVIWTTIRNGGF